MKNNFLKVLHIAAIYTDIHPDGDEPWKFIRFENGVHISPRKIINEINLIYGASYTSPKIEGLNQ
jgi:hypothetical protein